MRFSFGVIKALFKMAMKTGRKKGPENRVKDGN